jgi:hypothetical protein
MHLITSFISNVALALQYVPFVSSAVQQIETSNSSLPGATKKQLVLASISAAVKVGESVPEAHVALISALIDAIVTALNAAGVFGKKPVVVPVTA